TTQRGALVAKLLRVNLFGAVLNRPNVESWTDADRTEHATVAQTLIGEGGGIHEVLSRSDRALLDAICARESSTTRLIELAHARRRFFSPNALLPRRLSRSFHREAPLRMATATALQLR